MSASVTILIVEDGDEYRDTLTRFVPGPRYQQVRSAAAAIDALRAGAVSLVYLDMRFDRVPRDTLCGDAAQVAAARFGGDTERAWRHLQDQQGLYVLRALDDAGFGHLPVILSYDFTHEPGRYAALRRRYPNLRWVGDAVTAAEVRALIDELASP